MTTADVARRPRSRPTSSPASRWPACCCRRPSPTRASRACRRRPACWRCSRACWSTAGSGARASRSCRRRRRRPRCWARRRCRSPGTTPLLRAALAAGLVLATGARVPRGGRDAARLDLQLHLQAGAARVLVRPGAGDHPQAAAQPHRHASGRRRHAGGSRGSCSRRTAAMELERDGAGPRVAGRVEAAGAAAQAARRAAGDRGGHRRGAVRWAWARAASRWSGKIDLGLSAPSLPALVARPVDQHRGAVARAGAAGVRRELRRDPHDGAQARRRGRSEPRPRRARRGQPAVRPDPRHAGGRGLLGDRGQRGGRRDEPRSRPGSPASWCSRWCCCACRGSS